MTTLTTNGVTISVPSFTTYHNLGPLAPTSFPANCLTDFWNMQTIALGMPSVWTYHTQGCATSTCCPSSKFYTEGWAWMTSYYSPGVCPSQYKSCVPPSAPTALSSAPGETIVFCCPTNYDCPDAPGFFQFCQSAITGTQTATVMDNLINQKVLSVETWSASNQFEIVYPIQVRMKPGDTFSTTSSASGAITGGSSTEGSSSHLSTGAIIGIAFGAFFAVAFAVAGILFIYKSQQLRKRSDSPPTEPPIEQTFVAHEKAELPAPESELPVLYELPDSTAND